MMRQTIILAALISIAACNGGTSASRADDSAPSASGSTASEGKGSATNPPAKRARESEAFATLLNATEFSSPWAGRPQRPTEAARAFAELLDMPDAAEAVRALLEPQNSAAARLYGLCGLYFTDLELFVKTTAAYRSSEETVAYISSDIYLPAKPVTEIVFSSQSDLIGFNDPNTAVSEWLAVIDATGGAYSLDIARGGFSTALRFAGSTADRKPE